MARSSKLRPLFWLGSTKSDLMALPASVIDTFGFGLYLAQIGTRHIQAKPLHGFGTAGVLEIVEDLQGNTYRAVYTVRFTTAVYVLHVFQKKSTHGIATPKPDMNLIKIRLKAAATHAAKELS
ncbi:MAG: type II toxin-antitoxin system RelE/ParE family toxin [Usitatibacter sp.]